MGIGWGMGLDVLIWGSQSGLNTPWIKSLIQYSPNSYIIAYYLIIDALMKTICQSTIIPKMNFVYPCMVFKFINFAKNVFLKPCSQTKFKTVVETTNSDYVHNRRWEDGYVHGNAFLMISLTDTQGMGRSIPAATRASVF